MTVSVITPEGITQNSEYISTDKLAEIRKDLTVSKSPQSRLYEYDLGDGYKVTLNQTIGFPDNASDKFIAKYRNYVMSKKEGEVFAFETVLVNALRLQVEASKIFKIPFKSMFQGFNIQLDSKSESSNSLIDSWGNINPVILLEHSQALKGITDEQLSIELAGHLFHESMHQTDEIIFSESGALGEITSVTSQLAFYLYEGYTGPTSYNERRFSIGVKDLKDKDKHSPFDYNIATCVGTELILEQLRETFPDIKSDASNSYLINRDICSKVKPEDKEKLALCLRRAMELSNREEVFNGIIRKVKTTEIS